MQVHENAITIGHEELDGSPVESLDAGGLAAVRTLQCAFADRLALADELVGGDAIVGGTHIRQLPHPYPHDASALACEVRIEPFGATAAGGNAQVVEYSLARLSVTYRVPRHGPPAQEVMVSESLEPAAEFITLPHERLYWDLAASEPLSESEAPGRLVRMLEWVYIRHRLLSLPAATLELVGKVNDSALVSQTLGLTFPPGTLLYNPPRLEREITTGGVGAWRATYRFTYRPEGWNVFPRRGTQQMQTIYACDGSTCQPFTPYPDGDFHQLVG